MTHLYFLEHIGCIIYLSYQSKKGWILHDGTAASDEGQDHDERSDHDQNVISRPKLEHVQLADVIPEVPLVAEPNPETHHVAARQLHY